MIKTLKDFNFKNKKIILRADFNVPLDGKGNILNDKKIKATIPTIKYLLKNKAIIIIITHLGRPKGKIIKKLRTNKIAKRLSSLLRKRVFYLNKCIGKDVENFINKLSHGNIVVLENLRFYKEEKENNVKFAKLLSKLADIYVNDAFAVSHRKHASISAIIKFLPSYAGLLLEKEIKILNKIMKTRKKPFIAVLGGVKISDKIDLINSLLKKADKILIGGAMMFTFLKAKKLGIGKSIVENDKVSLAKRLLKNKKIILPVDVVVSNKFDENSKSKIVNTDKIPSNSFGLDIGKNTIKNYKKIIKKAKTIIWNGPLGKFEFKRFSKGTNEIAKAIAKAKIISVVGGGETSAVIEKLKLEGRVTHLSTGGGAFLEFIEGKKLPGIVALEENYKKFRL